jgi:hypothetical protein
VTDDIRFHSTHGSDVHHDFTQIVNAERGACPPSLVARPALRFPRSPPDKRTVIRENGEITPILRRCDRKRGLVAESHIFATFGAAVPLPQALKKRVNNGGCYPTFMIVAKR